MSSFSHSGMVGDLIYGLPAIRELGGGALRIFCRRPSTRMPVELVESLATLLLRQPYIASCEIDPEPAEYDLDRWTDHYTTGLTLADMTLRAFRCSTAARDRAWLEVERPRRAGRVIIHRTERYRNPDFPWDRVFERYKDDAVMIGYPDEHAQFCREVGSLPYLPTRDYLELAEIIAGCDLFIGNQSSPYAIAEALKVNTLQEVSPQYPNCVFEREGATYGSDQTVILPALR